MLKQTINCTVIIEGHTVIWPLELEEKDGKYFAIILFDKKTRKKEPIELYAALVEKPHGGLATWNYRGSIVVSEPTDAKERIETYLIALKHPKKTHNRQK